MKKDLTCSERVQKHFTGRMQDIRKLWEADCKGEESTDDLGSLNDYGLSFDYVAPNTFGDQDQGYFRYQLSWGGPSDEFRFYVNPDLTPYKIEYWFLDWFDGAPILLVDSDKTFMKEFFMMYFVETETAKYELDKAMKDL